MTLLNDLDLISVLQKRKSSFRSGGSRSTIRGAFRSGSSSSGSRTSPSIRNIRSGQTIRRPAGTSWVRSASTFLPLARRYSRRSTPIDGNENSTYVEIQCSSQDSDCCENENGQPFCCGSDIPSDYEYDYNKNAQAL
ncbi:unnamed protein product, partial [Didymodactylos carnosus]